MSLSVEDGKMLAGNGKMVWPFPSFADSALKRNYQQISSQQIGEIASVDLVAFLELINQVDSAHDLIIERDYQLIVV